MGGSGATDENTVARVSDGIGNIVRWLERAWKAARPRSPCSL